MESVTPRRKFLPEIQALRALSGTYMQTLAAPLEAALLQAMGK